MENRIGKIKLDSESNEKDEEQIGEIEQECVSIENCS